jgi:amino acid adenylation domain-containing protein
MKHESVQKLFSQAAGAFGPHNAIEYGNQRMTYHALEAKSNRLANFLLASGASRGAIVALMLDDPVEIIAAMLGTMKAGCAFVPLDPRSPESRLETMISQVAPKWFLTESGFLSSLESSALLNSCGCVVRVEDYSGFPDIQNPEVEMEPDDMCYVFFTSGSTGRPKGIAGRLKGIDHFIRWELRALALGEGVRVSNLTSASFDAVLRDIFVPLCAGGTVCVPPTRDTILDARKLIDWIDIEEINVVHCVPSLFRSILNEPLNRNYFSSLKYILMAGESILPSDLRKWFSVYDDRIQLVNLYGPSETTMTKFCYFVKPADKDRERIPIGQPIPGAAAVIVDAEGRSCPPGLIGEIYIRTPFRSLGYFNQPELTKAVFVPNPFSADPNDIVYKTGDLGRIRADGDFEFLGRRDQQVKIRGVRVELGEIENIVLAHESVMDACVVDREDAAGGKILAAYVVPAHQHFDPIVLRDHLLEFLPLEIVPSAFVTISDLPRTLSGKVDRKALPTPNQAGNLDVSYVAPRTPFEEMLVDIWSEVLGIKGIGVEHNFFELGGHSLLVFQITSRVRDAFGVELPLRSLFEGPTIALQSLAIMQAQLEQEDDAEIAQLIAEIGMLAPQAQTADLSGN